MKKFLTLTCALFSLLFCATFISCDNFLTAANFKTQLAQDIQFAEAESCEIFIKQNSTSGTFPYNSAKETLKLGYETELQFNLNVDYYVFEGLEAVNRDETESRSEYVEFTLNEKESDTTKGIYKISYLTYNIDSYITIVVMTHVETIVSLRLKER